MWLHGVDMAFTEAAMLDCWADEDEVDDALEDDEEDEEDEREDGEDVEPIDLDELMRLVGTSHLSLFIIK